MSIFSDIRRLSQVAKDLERIDPEIMSWITDQRNQEQLVSFIRTNFASIQAAVADQTQTNAPEVAPKEMSGTVTTTGITMEPAEDPALETNDGPPEFMIKYQSAGEHPMTGHKLYSAILFADGEPVYKAGPQNSKEGLKDELNIKMAEIESNFDGRPRVVKTNYGSEDNIVLPGESTVNADDDGYEMAMAKMDELYRQIALERAATEDSNSEIVNTDDTSSEPMVESNFDLDTNSISDLGIDLAETNTRELLGNFLEDALEDFLSDYFEDLEIDWESKELSVDGEVIYSESDSAAESNAAELAGAEANTYQGSQHNVDSLARVEDYDNGYYG